MTAIAILGEYAPAFAPHAATTAAIAHARARLGVAVDAEWMSTAAVDATLFERVDALWIAPGSPYKDLEQTLWAIREARERGVPCLGTCGGFQHMVLEYARHVLGFRDAQHAEYDPYASRLFVTQLACPAPTPRARRASSSCPAIPSSSARSLSPRPGRRRSGRIRW